MFQLADRGRIYKTQEICLVYVKETRIKDLDVQSKK